MSFPLLYFSFFKFISFLVFWFLSMFSTLSSLVSFLLYFLFCDSLILFSTSFLCLNSKRAKVWYFSHALSCLIKALRFLLCILISYLWLFLFFLFHLIFHYSIHGKTIILIVLYFIKKNMFSYMGNVFLHDILFFISYLCLTHNVFIWSFAVSFQLLIFEGQMTSWVNYLKPVSAGEEARTMCMSCRDNRLLRMRLLSRVRLLDFTPTSQWK